MRISDWSSDVCSSDLAAGVEDSRRVVGRDLGGRQGPIGEHRIIARSADHVLECSCAFKRCRRARDDHVAQARQVGIVLGEAPVPPLVGDRSEEHTSELQSLMRISYAVFGLKKKKTTETT